MSSVVSLSSYDYAAGTWALRLTGQVSSLSALTDRVVLKRSRFHLRLWEDLDDSGPLQSGPLLPDRPRAPSTSSAPAFEVSGHGPDLANLSHLVQTYVQHYLQEQGLTPPSQGLSQGPYSLAPVGLVRHRLAVAGEAAVNVSLMQLADLATVLGQAEQAVEPMPEALALSEQRSSRPRRPFRLPLWTGSVAAVLVAAVLGSQWLGQSPPVLVQSPTPTTETRTPGDAARGGGTSPEGSTSLDAVEGAAEGADNAAVLEQEATPADQPGSQGPPGEQRLTTPQVSGGTSNSTSPANPTPPSASGTPPSLPSAAPEVAPRRSRPNRSAAPRPQPRPDSLATSPPSAEALPPVASAPAPPSGEMGEQLRVPAAASSVPMPAPDAPETPVPELAPNTSSDLAPTPFATGLSDTAPANDPANDLEPLRRALAAVWNPIPGLASPLRYRLTLGPTGEILAIEPLTAPSRQYLAQNAWPQVGERVPNLRLPEPTIVEVELLSSGEVNLHQPP